MYENVQILDTILVLCIDSMAAGNQSFASLTQGKMYTDPEWSFESQVTANSFGNIKLKHFKKAKTNLPGWSCHISNKTQTKWILKPQ